MARKYGFSFSWKRALGISGMRNKIARATGIPTTRSGMERKIGRMATGGGCVLAIFTIPLSLVATFVQMILHIRH